MFKGKISALIRRWPQDLLLVDVTQKNIKLPRNRRGFSF